MLQPNSLDRGIRKTLHAYAAPKAICRQTPATAIHQRFDTRIFPPLASPRASARQNQTVRYDAFSMWVLKHASYVTSVQWSTPPRACVTARAPLVPGKSSLPRLKFWQSVRRSIGGRIVAAMTVLGVVALAHFHFGSCCGRHLSLGSRP